jgi:hypothetical protein
VLQKVFAIFIFKRIVYVWNYVILNCVSWDVLYILFIGLCIDIDYTIK